MSLQFYRDIGRFFRFRHEMKSLEREAKKDPSSEFARKEFTTNTIGNIVSKTIVIGDEELARLDYSVLDVLDSMTKDDIPFFVERGWGDYLVPNIFNVEDSDTGERLATYFVTYIFSPIEFTWKGLLKRLGIFLGIIAAVTTALVIFL